MSEMVMRVARALFDHAVDGLPGASWDAEDRDVCSHYLGAARAAIKAMREPTDAMFEQIQVEVNLTNEPGGHIWERGLLEALG